MQAGPEEIAGAVSRLRSGGVVAFPTETVYGLGADALNGAAVARVFALKERPASNPLIVHVVDEEQARRVAGAWPAGAGKLARAFWPGPLTIVVPKGAGVPAIVTGGGRTVGVRCPDHLVTLSLLEAFGGPLVGPSANPSGRVSPTTAEHVREAFGEEDVYVLDGGPCRGGLESTVVSLAERPARVLRPGLVSAEQIEAVLGEEVERGWMGGDAGTEGALPGPGMMASHYAPRTRMVVVGREGLEGALAGVRRAVVLMVHGEAAPPHVTIRMPREAGAYAARLYAALREADRAGADLIVVERMWEGQGEGAGVWAAVEDRLRRASAGRGGG